MTNSKSKPWYEKAHTFRLTRNDALLYNFLESLNRNEKSETIREMLRFALEHNFNGNLQTPSGSSREDLDGDSIDCILSELKAIKELQQESHDDILNAISSADITGSKETKEEEQMNESISETKNMLFEEFGIDF